MKIVNRNIFFIIIALTILTSAGCSKIFTPSFPKDEIPEAIKRLCKQDYNINEQIDVNLNGKTLGVRIHFDNLLDTDFKLNENALDKLQDLLKVIRRICLSTDAELDFFVIIGYEEKLGMEIVFYSYIDDLKRVIAGWMSPDDYFERLVKTMRMGTLIWGENRVNKLIQDIESGNMVKVISNNFATGINIDNLNYDFLKVLVDLSKKSKIQWLIKKSYSTPIAEQQRLYYIEAKEFFTTKPGETDKLQYPSETLHKFYFLVDVEDLKPVIVNVYTEDTLPEKYYILGYPSTWNENDFYVEDFVFHKFLSNQIIQRIQSAMTKEEKEKETDTMKQYSIKGDFVIKDQINYDIELDDPSNNVYNVIITGQKDTLKEPPQEVIDIILETIKKVCDKYKFYDMGEIRLQDTQGNILYSVDKITLFNNK